MDVRTNDDEATAPKALHPSDSRANPPSRAAGRGGPGRIVRTIGALLGALVLMVGALAALQVAGVVSLFGGGRGLDAWAARSVADLLEYYIVPDIEFETFALSASDVTMERVALVAADGTNVLTADRLVVGLPGVPRRGRPIRIERVEIHGGVLRLIQTERVTAEGERVRGFRGLVPFVDRGRVRAQEEAPEGKRLSEVLRIRRIALIDGSILLDTLGDDPPMRLDGITMDLDVEPEEGEEPGWYALDAHLDRSPVLDIDTDARLNVDTFTLDVRALRGGAALSEEGMAALPPPVQSFLREHEVSGAVRVEADGVVPLRDWRSGDFHARLSSDGATAAIGRGRLPIDRALVVIDLLEGSLSISPVEMTALGGEVRGSASLDLRADFLPLRMNWTARDLHLERAVRATRAPAEGEEGTPALAGDLTTTGRASMELLNLPFSIEGGGTIRVEQGRLVNVPIVQAMLNAAQSLGLDGGTNDSALVEFLLRPEGVRIEDLEILDPSMGLRAEGMVFYNGGLTLSANAGPMEGLQARLGALGDLLGDLTDRLVTYRVRGTLESPTVEVVPFGSRD
jgi:hypothetical protein